MKNVILKMINEKRLLKIVYDDEERIIEPYYLFIYRNNNYKSLYVIGYCHLRMSPRIFKVARIQSRRQLTESWTMKPFSLSKVDLSHFERSKINFIGYPQEIADQILMDGYSTQDNLEKKIYPQKIQLSKMKNPGVCRSPLEERVIREYNNYSNVENIVIEPYKIEYSLLNEKKTYIPDLLINFKDGSKQLIEIKLSSEISEFQNQQKFIAATEFAKNNNMKFIIVGMDIMGSNYRKTGEFGWNKQTEINRIHNFDIDYKFRNKIDSYEFVKPQYSKNIISNPKNNKNFMGEFNWGCIVPIGIVITLLIVIIVLVSSNNEEDEENPYSETSVDHDCSDFPSQHDAQLFFEANGGPDSDYHDLDRDGDGMACDWNP